MANHRLTICDRYEVINWNGGVNFKEKRPLPHYHFYRKIPSMFAIGTDQPNVATFDHLDPASIALEPSCLGKVQSTLQLGAAIFSVEA